MCFVVDRLWRAQMTTKCERGEKLAVQEYCWYHHKRLGTNTTLPQFLENYGELDRGLKWRKEKDSGF